VTSLGCSFQANFHTIDEVTAGGGLCQKKLRDIKINDIIVCVEVAKGVLA
jgi:hypothetical protein